MLGEQDSDERGVPAAAAKPGKATADRERSEMKTWSAEQLTAFLAAERDGRSGPRGRTCDHRVPAWGGGLRWSDVAAEYTSVTVR